MAFESRSWLGSCRAVIDKETIHVPDVLAELATEFPESKES